ncbi:cAMP-specific 3',5'-cyclic phosphodiesterase 4B-like isoform X1 [Pitangus sulphuratus]|nr:cAMP-specific 3',5'-cyclic phosphodiesterase 4B-like isoform X1 [Pitangus sulphuratus]
MKKSRSVMTVTADENALDYLECGLSKSYSTSTHALGIDLWRGRRCCSGNLQLPPLSQRQTEKARTPDRDIVCRPTTLPLLTPPSIAITTYQDWQDLTEFVVLPGELQLIHDIPSLEVSKARLGGALSNLG